MVNAVRDMDLFVLDSSEEGEDSVELHEAAWRGDVELLESLLGNPRYASAINVRLKPFLATPLRLAASKGRFECVRILISRGANVDLPDRKNQTPLFCSVTNMDLRSCKLLLEAGAIPEGHPGNLSTPLLMACQIGFAAGLQMLLDYGARVEGSKILLHIPSPHPLRIAATYGHLGCFIALLCAGGITASAADCLHIICNKRKHPIFVKLWWEFGGNFWYKDSSGLLAVDVADHHLAELVRTLMDTPLSLQSQCRLKWRQSHPNANTKPIRHPYVRDFVQYRDILEVRVFKKLVREEINHPTGVDLEARLMNICVQNNSE